MSPLRSYPLHRIATVRYTLWKILRDELHYFPVLANFLNNEIIAGILQHTPDPWNTRYKPSLQNNWILSLFDSHILLCCAENLFCGAMYF